MVVAVASLKADLLRRLLSLFLRRRPLLLPTLPFEEDLPFHRSGKSFEMVVSFPLSVPVPVVSTGLRLCADGELDALVFGGTDGPVGCGKAGLKVWLHEGV